MLKKKTENPVSQFPLFIIKINNISLPVITEIPQKINHSHSFHVGLHPVLLLLGEILMQLQLDFLTIQLNEQKAQE